MKNEIIMIDRNSLKIASVNHRQDGARKMQGQVWLDGMKPLIVARHDEYYIILDGFRRFTYLSRCTTFPCLVVDADTSTDEATQKAIEQYKGDTLALSIVEVCKFGCDKVRYGIGKYLAKDGETMFLEAMIAVYEDYHPNPSGNGDVGDKENRKALKNYHKGLNQSVFRACMLGETYVTDYCDKVKGVTTALRVAYEAARKAQMRGLSWADARFEARPVYVGELARLVGKKEKEEKSVDGIGNYVSHFAVTLNEAEMDEEKKKHYGKLLLCVVQNDVEGFMKEILGK